MFFSSCTFSLSASIGIALYPENGGTFDELLNVADKVMYRIKHKQKNGYCFVSEIEITELQLTAPAISQH